MIIAAALYFGVSQIAQTYDKWMNAPVIVTFATTQTPIWNVPFPAITICPEVKSQKSLFNYTDIYLKKENGRELTEKELVLHNIQNLVELFIRFFFQENRIRIYVFGMQH